MEQVVQETQQAEQPSQVATEAPASPSVETSAKPEEQVGQEGTETKVEAEETPQKRESRRQRQLNRERERRIQAETELRLLREQYQARQPKAEEASDEPQREKFNSYEEYIEARATWRAEKAAEERARKILEESRKEETESRDKQSQEAKVREWNAKLDKARDEIEDFEEVCADSEAPVTKPMSDAILESDKGPLIAYYLAKNPEEAERISKLSPSKQAAAIVNLEDKVSRPVKQPSKAPDPIRPVGQKAEVGKDPTRMTDEEYSAWRRERKEKGLR